MASNIIKGSSIKNVVVRGYAAQAAVAMKQQNYSLPQHQPEVTRLPNGALAISLENNSPVSKLAIFAQSGSRYETECAMGASHMARLCAGTTTESFLALGLTRRIQQMGSNLVCHAGREHMSYGMSFLRDNLPESFELLSSVVLEPSFFPWEVQKQKRRVQTELAMRDPSGRALEMLHAAAFRRAGLGNSLFTPGNQVGKITADQLHAFVRGTHTPSRVAFVGLGMDHKALVKLAKGIKTAADDGGTSSPVTVYGGGEIRKETGRPLAYVAMAGPGAKLGTAEATALGIAQFVLGGAPGTSRGGNASGKLASLLKATGCQGNATAINAAYSDAGIFGFLLTVNSEDAQVLKALTKGVRGLKLTEGDVNGAKARAKAAVLMAAECGEGEVSEMGLQGLFSGSYAGPEETLEAIDKVTTASVQSALSTATKGKPSMSAYGGISKVPYLDEL